MNGVFLKSISFLEKNRIFFEFQILEENFSGVKDGLLDDKKIEINK